jgi:hypothetical protein
VAASVQRLVDVLGVAALGALLLSSQVGVYATSGSATEDPPNTHNMILVGEHAVFLSHFPLFGTLRSDKHRFDSPHRYQVILEVSLGQNGKSAADIYTADRKNNPSVLMYTLNPEDFVLSRLSDRTPPPQRLESFRGTVFRGHLERGGKEIEGLQNIQVNVKRVIYFQELSPDVSRPAHLEYVLFGRGKELFLAHRISQPPDFDQILSIQVSGSYLTDEALGRGIDVVFPTRDNTAEDRMREKQTATASVRINSKKTEKLSIETLREFYFEEGELFSPPTFQQTPLEKQAEF